MSVWEAEVVELGGQITRRRGNSCGVEETSRAVVRDDADGALAVCAGAFAPGVGADACTEVARGVKNHRTSSLTVK
jgi:hypothetical protein